ncbi:MAG: DUF362 domain-containing protein [candidate division KSB1 bacterium]|nr:DUF362 domain-containing protein [candidate division KSB1 bacterium]MDZ7303813.1 DUF362 domain-containing protein [candidate division KSB1 bacterium]MDZ7314176.1 DUF362 domain-containing protein [candidate division KSB1 bacterium]
MINRRAFLKAAAAGGALIFTPVRALSSYFRDPPEFFGVHPFVEHHPEAVFIVRTNVEVKTDAAAKKQVGLDFGRSVFVRLGEGEGGIPLTHQVVIKPNLTCRGKWDNRYTIEGAMGIVTDAYFVEGIIESLKELGLSGSQFYIRETNCPQDFEEGGYWDMARRTGADLRDLSAKVGVISESDLQWTEVPDGVWFKKIPHLWPVNAPNTFFLNIAKLKTHAMGMTLCAKNLQGTIAHNYQEHCVAYHANMDVAPDHINPNAKAEIFANYNRHVADRIPRWDKPGDDGGLWQETWATRCLDNNSVTHPALHIIEGIYGRDGHFIAGPSPEGLATDYMINMIIFGKNPFYVDIIGHWLGGHEPGNFGLFHLARERGFISLLDPGRIPVYEWKPEGTAILTPLTDFARTPLKTFYLQRNYAGQNEPYWHLVDEPYDYTTDIEPSRISPKPESFILRQNYPNPFGRLPFNSSTAIEFTIPHDGHVRLEIFNITGERVAMLVDKHCEKGAHLAVWKTHDQPSGIYFYRFGYAGFSETKRMLVVR